MRSVKKVLITHNILFLVNDTAIKYLKTTWAQNEQASSFYKTRLLQNKRYSSKVVTGKMYCGDNFFGYT